MSDKVILHIGTPKSGTTFIQTLLWRNKRALASAGVLIPGTRRGDHVTAANFARTTRPNHREVETWARLEEQIRQWPGTSILSNEWFSLASAEQAAAFIQRLGGPEVHVVATVRNFAATVPAAWQEWLKLGHGSSFPEFYKDFQDNKAERWNWSTLDPTRFLPAWSSLVEPQHVHVVTVPPRSLGPNLLWQRFALACGIDQVKCKTNAAKANESIGAASARFLELMGPRLRDAINVEAEPSGQIKWIRNYMSHALLSPQKGDKVAVDREFADELAGRSQQVADDLEQRGYRVHGDLDELRNPAANGTVKPANVTDSEVWDVAAQVIPEMLRRIQAESKRADEAVAALKEAELELRSAVPASYEPPGDRGEWRFAAQWATKSLAVASKVAARQRNRLSAAWKAQGPRGSSAQPERNVAGHDIDGPPRKTVHFTVNTLALKRGGLVKAVRERANALAEHTDLEVWIEVLSFQRTLARDVKTLKEQGQLHRRVQVRSVIYSLDDSPRRDLRAPWIPPEADGWSQQAGPSKHSVDYLYRGQLHYQVKVTAKGAATQVDHFDDRSQLRRRDYLDVNSRPIRRLSFDHASKTQTTEEYIGRDGSVFLAIRSEPGTSDGITAQVQNRQPRTFHSMDSLYQHALERIAAMDRAPVICSEFRENPSKMLEGNLDDVVRAVRNPGALKVAVVHSNHLQPPYVRGAGVGNNWRRLLDNLADFDTLVVLTEAQRDDLMAEYDAGDRVDVVPHAVYSAGLTNRDTDPNRIVVVSRTHPKKRMDEAIRVFKAISCRMPDAYLEVFGFGYGDAESAKIEDLIAELELGSKVTFMPFTDDQDAIYGSAAFTLMTSASEGFGMVLLESMSHGVPVLAYDAKYGPSDVIDDGQNGYLVPFGDHEALAERAVEVMTDADLRYKLKLNAKETAGRFDRAAFVSSWSNILHRPPRSDRTDRNQTPEYDRVIHAVRDEGPDLVLEVVDTLPQGTALICRRPGEHDLVHDMAERCWRIPRSAMEGDATESYYRLPGDDRAFAIPAVRF